MTAPIVTPIGKLILNILYPGYIEVFGDVQVEAKRSERRARVEEASRVAFNAA